MPLPANWSLVGTRPVWDAATGWQSEHTYRGPADESDLQGIVDTVSGGATRLTLDKQVIGRNTADTEYTYLVTLTVSYAATGPGGTPRPPDDPEYGLFSRTWELQWERHYVPLVASPQAEVLAAAAPDWPALIERAADEYRRRLKEWQEALLEDEAAPKPDIAAYRAGLLSGAALHAAAYRQRPADRAAQAQFQKVVFPDRHPGDPRSRQPHATCRVAQDDGEMFWVLGHAVVNQRYLHRLPRAVRAATARIDIKTRFRDKQQAFLDFVLQHNNTSPSASRNWTRKT